MRQKALQGLALAAWLALASGWLAGQAGAPVHASPGSASPGSNAPAAGLPASGAMVKQLGSIRRIDGTRLTLATDQGGEVAVKVQPGARLLRLAPGQTDLKSATAIALTDLQVGDRVLVWGKADEDGASLDAAAVLVMKQQDIAQRQRAEMLDWQRRGVGGLARQVDVEAGTVTLSVAGTSLTGASAAGASPTGTPAKETSNPAAGSGGTVVIHATPKTTYKRYAPGSMKWEEATASRLDEIHAGDQLRAKGNRSEDGAQMEAEEMVSGSFRNIAGLVTAIDAAQGTLTVEDLATKKPVTVKVTVDTQMRKLPAPMAQALAMRLKGGSAMDAASNDAASKAGAEANQAGTPARGARARGGDLNQMLARLPAATLGDLQKGEAVMIVSTTGEGGQLPEAVTLLGGVEPILTANPGGRGTESLLTPWSLASAPGGDQP